MSPLAVYIHWPFCKSKCPYCDFNSHVREAVDMAHWQQALLGELEYMASHVPGRLVGSIFFGGGTPSLMPPAIAEALIKRVHELWQVTPNIEITLEANPTSVETHTFADFAAAGVNRVSLGVQSLDDQELKFLGRGHSVKEALVAIERAAKIFGRYTFDLIYARPNQTVITWERELKKALEYAGTHLSLYQLTIEENTAFHHAYKKGEFVLPDEETSEALYRLTEEVMESRGIPAYEVSNYAAPGDESRHNLAYWKGHDYVGIGPGAHGRLTINGIRIATQTLKSPERWLEAVERKQHAVELWEPVPPEAEREERIMMGLRLREGIALDAIHGAIDSAKKQFLVGQGLLEDDARYLRPTLKGRLLLNQLTAALI